MEKLETGFTKSEHYCSSEIPLSVFQKRGKRPRQLCFTWMISRKNFKRSTARFSTTLRTSGLQSWEAEN